MQLIAIQVNITTSCILFKMKSAQCIDTCNGRYALETCCGDMLQTQCSSSDIPVMAKRSVAGTEFCPHNMLHEIQLV